MSKPMFKARTVGTGRPLLTFYVGVHGDEQAPIGGMRLLLRRCRPERFRKALRIVIANPAAVAAGRRFVECDLNRAFPGARDGRYEERLAHALLSELPPTRYNFDFHSTSFAMTPYCVLSDLGSDVEAIARLIKTTNFVVSQQESLVRYTNNGMAFEVGPDQDLCSAETICAQMMDILAVFGVLGGAQRRAKAAAPSLCFVYNRLEKSHFRALDAKVTDFASVRRGQRIGIGTSGEEIRASAAFVPVWVNDPHTVKIAKRVKLWNSTGGQRAWQPTY